MFGGEGNGGGGGEFGPVTIQMSVNFCKFARLYPR